MSGLFLLHLLVSMVSVSLTVLVGFCSPVVLQNHPAQVFSLSSVGGRVSGGAPGLCLL